MHTYRSNESKKVRNMNITNNLDSSLISNKSKNSFRDLNDYRSKLFLNFRPHSSGKAKSSATIRECVKSQINVK